MDSNEKCTWFIYFIWYVNILKSSLFGLDLNQKASMYQHFICSTGASAACIAVSSPLDVIKTRIQNKDF